MKKSIVIFCCLCFMANLQAATRVMDAPVAVVDSTTKTITKHSTVTHPQKTNGCALASGITAVLSLGLGIGGISTNAVFWRITMINFMTSIVFAFLSMIFRLIFSLPNNPKRKRNIWLTVGTLSLTILASTFVILLLHNASQAILCGVIFCWLFGI
jgi:hypothetical protein